MLKLKSIKSVHGVDVNKKIVVEVIKNLGWSLKLSLSDRLIKGGYYLNNTSWFSRDNHEFGKIYVFIGDKAVYVASIPNYEKIHDRSGRSNIFRIASLERLKEFKAQFLKLSNVYDKLYFTNSELISTCRVGVLRDKEVFINTKYFPYKFNGFVQDQFYDVDKGLKLIVMLDRKISGITTGGYRYKDVSLVMITVYPKLINYLNTGEYCSSKISYYKQDLTTRYNEKLYLDSNAKLREDDIVITIDAKIQLK